MREDHLTKQILIDRRKVQRTVAQLFSDLPSRTHNFIATAIAKRYGQIQFFIIDRENSALSIKATIS